MRNLDKLGIFMTLLKFEIEILKTFQNIARNLFSSTAITLTILETANPPASRASIG